MFALTNPEMRSELLEKLHANEVQEFKWEFSLQHPALGAVVDTYTGSLCNFEDEAVSDDAVYVRLWKNNATTTNKKIWIEGRDDHGKIDISLWVHRPESRDDEMVFMVYHEGKEVFQYVFQSNSDEFPEVDAVTFTIEKFT